MSLRIGPFVVRYRGDDETLAQTLHDHFPDYPLADPDGFADASISLRPRALWQRAERVLCLEDETPFTRFPEAAMLAHLEWSLNWCVATRANQYVMLHGAVVAQGERAVLMPGAPGAGKSTLCAYLALNGWRLLSDEFTLIRDASLAVQPFPRLIPLKNASIALIDALVPTDRWGPTIEGTHKGTVAHLKPDPTHVARMAECATASAIVFPSYQAEARTELRPIPKSECFSLLTDHAFNYRLLGAEGFSRLAALADRAPAHRLVYSDLANASRVIEDLLEATPR